MTAPFVHQAVRAADYDVVGKLFREYVDQLPFSLDFQDFDAEMRRLPDEYGPPYGAAFIAVADGEPVGVAAVRRLPSGEAELKRMYLRPQVRRLGLGRLLARHAIAAARRSGAARIVLDTVVSVMPVANQLYESLGFFDIPPYRFNPFPDARFMAVDLIDWTGGPPVGVVLAGGESRRMGKDKRTVEIGGESMLSIVGGAMETAGVTVVISGPPSPLRTRWAHLADAAGVHGPVAGLLTMLRRFPGRDLMMVGTDQPYLRPQTVSKMLAIPGAAVCVVDDIRQPLCAVYRDPCLPVIENMVTHDPRPSLQNVLETVVAMDVPSSSWRRWGEDGRSWLSVDTPEQLEAVRRTWPELPTAENA